MLNSRRHSEKYPQTYIELSHSQPCAAVSDQNHVRFVARWQVLCVNMRGGGVTAMQRCESCVVLGSAASRGCVLSEIRLEEGLGKNVWMRGALYNSDTFEMIRR